MSKKRIERVNTPFILGSRPLTNNDDEATLSVITPISAIPSLGFYGLAVLAVLLAAVAVHRVRLA